MLPALCARVREAKRKARIVRSEPSKHSKVPKGGLALFVFLSVYLIMNESMTWSKISSDAAYKSSDAAYPIVYALPLATNTTSVVFVGGLL